MPQVDTERELREREYEEWFLLALAAIRTADDTSELRCILRPVYEEGIRRAALRRAEAPEEKKS